MIRTVADLLLEILKKELPKLDAVQIKHAPTIGDMYEGLSARLLNHAMPTNLGLRVVTGFVTDGHGNMSGQLDCMLVRGDGERIPYTNSFVWHIRDLVAVIEVKKSLHSAEISEAFKQLYKVYALEREYLQELTESEHGTSVDIGPAWRNFAQMTGNAVPQSGDLSSLSYHEEVVFRTLINEQLSSVRIILGLHGYKSEQAFRTAVVDLLEANVGLAEFGVPAFPQLIISGNYTLAKANGRPYNTIMREGWWPLCFSTPVNPLIMLLEYIWTRLDELYGIGPEAWGEDLDIEVARGLLSARAIKTGRRKGWELQVHEASKKALNAIPVEKPWSPAFVTLEVFAILSRLNAGHGVRLDDPQLLAWLAGRGVTVEVLRDSLRETKLVAFDGLKVQLITDKCGLAILPTGEFIAAEDNSGRLTRWIGQRIAAIEVSDSSSDHHRS